MIPERINDRDIRDMKREERASRRENWERNRKDDETFDPEAEEQAMFYLTKNSKNKKRK